MQDSRPRTITCPVIFGLGVQVERSFGTKWLVNHLERLGFPISYDDVTQYKQPAVESSTTEFSNLHMEDKAFVQRFADNVDHNQLSVTGKGTFHGIISASTF